MPIGVTDKQGSFEELDWTRNILEAEWRGVVLALHDGGNSTSQRSR